MVLLILIFKLILIYSTFDLYFKSLNYNNLLLPNSNTKVSKHIQIRENSVELYFRKFDDIINIIIQIFI